VNKERFGQLVRGFVTNRLSRHQVLRRFAAGVLLAGPLGTPSRAGYPHNGD
jgi:hypothetical protein